MALLVVLKLVATATCYASGNAGGIFRPSLFLGAMMGGAVGGVAHMLFPDYTGSVGAYALVGMGAAFAGIVRVPLTSVIMVFEITRDYSIEGAIPPEPRGPLWKARPSRCAGSDSALERVMAKLAAR